MFQKGRRVYELVDMHYDKVVECYNEAMNFVEMYLCDPCNPELDEQCAKVYLLESTADQLRRDLISEFLNGAMLPHTRKEILSIAQMVDNIADKAQDICRLIHLEGVNFHDDIKPKIMEMLRLTGDQLGHLSLSLEQLFSDYEQLVQAGGSIAEISNDEKAIDIIEEALIKNIYSLEIDLAEKNHIRRFISQTAQISDHIEDIADQLTIMVVLRTV